MAGTAIGGVHSTIANTTIHLRDIPTASNASAFLVESGALGVTATLGTPAVALPAPDTTASVHQKGALFVVTDTTKFASGLYVNNGTFAAPIWSNIGASGFPQVNGSLGPIFCTDNSLTANQILITVYSAGSVKVPLATGLTVLVRLKNAIAVGGAPTVNFNGTTKNLNSPTQPLVQLNSAVAAGSILMMVYLPSVTTSAIWQCISYTGTR